VLLLLATPATAADSDVGVQLAGLLMQSCVAYAGDTAGLRDWARRLSLAEVREPARTMFLHGASGVVFDASNAGGKFVLVSADQGSCSVLTDAAPGSQVTVALESDFAELGIRFHVTGEHDDDKEAALHYREYAADRNGRRWRIVAGTVKGQQPGQAMLTADPD
jgi:hypothetical protein